MAFSSLREEGGTIAFPGIEKRIAFFAYFFDFLMVMQWMIY